MVDDVQKQCERGVLRPMSAEEIAQLEAALSNQTLLESPALRRIPFIQHIVSQPHASETELAQRKFEDTVRGVLGIQELRAMIRNPKAPFKLKETALVVAATYATLSTIRDLHKVEKYMGGLEQDGLELSPHSKAIYNISISLSQLPQTLDGRGAAVALNDLLARLDNTDQLPPDLKLLADNQHQIIRQRAALNAFPAPVTVEFQRMPREERLRYDQASFALRELQLEGLEMAHQYVQERIKQLGENATPAQVLQLATAAIAVGCHRTPAPDTGTISAELHPSGIASTGPRAEVAAAATLP